MPPILNVESISAFPSLSHEWSWHPNRRSKRSSLDSTVITPSSPSKLRGNTKTKFSSVESNSINSSSLLGVYVLPEKFANVTGYISS